MRTTCNIRVEREHEARLLAVAAVGESEDRPAQRRRIAQMRGVNERSVRRWEQRQREGTLAATPPGPKPTVLDWETRQGVIALLVALGPLAGVDAVRAIFEGVPYRMIRSMKQRLARVLRRRKGRTERRLTWFEPGSVWAMDFTKPGAKLPGKQRCLLMVRDLASGRRLASVPCRGERAAVVGSTLRALFAAHGAPLVMKFDNGPGFRAHDTGHLLEERGVVALASPVYRPQYNGSMERSLGWAKVRIEYLAAKQGHPRVWTEENIDQAREQANVTLRPWGARGPTPFEAFAQRQTITKKKRRAFKQTVDRRIQELLKTQMDDAGTLQTEIPYEVTERKAITHALHKHGYLKIRRGR